MKDIEFLDNQIRVNQKIYTYDHIKSARFKAAVVGQPFIIRLNNHRIKIYSIDNQYGRCYFFLKKHNIKIENVNSVSLMPIAVSIEEYKKYRDEIIGIYQGYIDHLKKVCEKNGYIIQAKTVEVKKNNVQEVVLDDILQVKDSDVLFGNIYVTLMKKVDDKLLYVMNQDNEYIYTVYRFASKHAGNPVELELLMDKLFLKYIERDMIKQINSIEEERYSDTFQILDSIQEKRS